MKKIIPIIVLIILIFLCLLYGSKIYSNRMVFSEPSKDDNSILAVYINGVLSSTFPNTGNYAAHVECLDSSHEPSQASGTAIWNGTKWEVEFFDIVADGTNCMVYFDDREPRGWSDPESGSLLEALSGRLVRLSPVTTPGVENPTTNEGLNIAPDDYGTSYYFRGSVTNNYVVFANMCWRIVRIDGAGNIKLVLYNYNPNNVTNPCATSENAATNAFARVNGTYLSPFNTNSNKNTYVGYMYSNNPDSNDFNIAHANDNDSTILTFLKNWYDQKLRTYNDMLADVIWCNDKSIVTDTTYNLYNYSPIGTGLGNDVTYYKALQRLYPYDSTSSTYSISIATPSLVCPNAGADGKLSKFTARDATNGNAKLYSDNKEYKIGLLTADEIAYAGSRQLTTQSTVNYSDFLGGPNITVNWWSMTPIVFGGTNNDYYAYVYHVKTTGYLTGIKVSGANDAVRPSIALKSDVMINQIAQQDGTSSYPYKVIAN